MRISASKVSNVTLYKHISLKLIVKFINLRWWKKAFIAAHMLWRPQVCSLQSFFLHLHFIMTSLN